MIDRLFAPHTPEAIAHSHLTRENWFLWDPTHPDLDETLIAGCATYQAFLRYLSGADIYIYPRNRRELQGVLQRYVYDAVHNAISRSRNPIARGGYSRICHLAEEKITNVLDNREHTQELLAMHRQHQPEDTPAVSHGHGHTHGHISQPALDAVVHADMIERTPTPKIRTR